MQVAMQIPRMRTSQAEVTRSVRSLRPEQAKGDLGTERNPLLLEKKSQVGSECKQMKSER